MMQIYAEQHMMPDLSVTGSEAIDVSAQLMTASSNQNSMKQSKEITKLNQGF